MSHWKILPNTENQFYFLTATIIDWTYVFTSQPYFEIIIESLRHCQTQKEFRLSGYVIMPNHLHLICAGSVRHPLSNTMRDFKQFTAKRIIEQLKSEQRKENLNAFQIAARKDRRSSDYKIWVDGNHPILVSNETMFREKLHYLHQNPVRKGYVERQEHWLYSSARNYVLGDHSILKVECLI